MRENRPRIKPEEVQFQDELSDDNQVHSNQVNLKEFTQLILAILNIKSKSFFFR